MIKEIIKSVAEFLAAFAVAAIIAVFIVFIFENTVEGIGLFKENEKMRSEESLRKTWVEYCRDGHLVSFDVFMDIYQIGYDDGKYYESFWDYCEHHCKNKTDDCKTKCEKRKQYLEWCEGVENEN